VWVSYISFMGDILAFSSLHVELSYFVLFELLLFFMSGILYHVTCLCLFPLGIF